jgi:hypothetical protein
MLLTPNTHRHAYTAPRSNVYVLGEGCASWYVPNPTTLQVIENSYGVTIQDLSQSLLAFFVGGPHIPDYTTDRAGFEQVVQAIYGH